MPTLARPLPTPPTRQILRPGGDALRPGYLHRAHVRKCKCKCNAYATHAREHQASIQDKVRERVTAVKVRRGEEPEAVPAEYDDHYGVKGARMPRVAGRRGMITVVRAAAETWRECWLR